LRNKNRLIKKLNTIKNKIMIFKYPKFGEILLKNILAKLEKKIIFMKKNLLKVDKIINIFIKFRKVINAFCKKVRIK